MEIVPESRSILDLISRWDADNLCPVFACPVVNVDRWFDPDIAFIPGNEACPMHAVELAPPGMRERIKDGLRLTAEVRHRIGLDNPRVQDVLQPGSFWAAERAPVVLCGSTTSGQFNCTMSAFKVRGFSRISAQELMARRPVMKGPEFAAYPTEEPFGSEEAPEVSEVHIWLAGVVAHRDAPGARLFRLWNWRDPYGELVESQESPLLITSEIADDMNRALRSPSGFPGRGGRRPLDRGSCLRELQDLADDWNSCYRRMPESEEEFRAHFRVSGKSLTHDKLVRRLNRAGIGTWSNFCDRFLVKSNKSRGAKFSRN